jgi:acetyltransferase-like isoleucine patch superfamily enzyme
MSQPTLGPGSLLNEDFMRSRFKQLGNNVKIFTGARIDHPEAIAIGDNSQIDEGVFMFAGNGIDIGRHVHFAFTSSVSGGGRCIIGDYVSIGAGVRLISGSENIAEGLTNPTVPSNQREVQRSSIEVGNHAVIFTNSIIFPGVKIGEGAVVSAGSIVHHNLKPWTVYGGMPLTAIKTRDKNKVAAAGQ